MLTSVVQGVAEAECRRAADAAEEAYVGAFREGSVEPDEAALHAEHRHACEAASAAYEAAAIGEPSVLTPSSSSLPPALASDVCNTRLRDL